MSLDVDSDDDSDVDPPDGAGGEPDTGDDGGTDGGDDGGTGGGAGGDAETGGTEPTPVENLVKDLAKKTVKGALEKGGAETTVASATSALSGLYFYLAIGAVILIVVGGFLLFFLLVVPGKMVPKLKKFGSGFLDYFQSKIEGEHTIVHGEDILEVANYLENMHFDLRGEGFVTKDVTESGDAPANSKPDTLQGVYRDNESDDITGIESDVIRTYLVSDNLTYLIKNFNTNLHDRTGGHEGLFIGGLAAGAIVLGAVLWIFFSPVALLLEAGLLASILYSSNPNWGSGLISIYHEEGGNIGQRGKAYSKLERGFISLDPNSKTLKIKRGWGGRNL